MIYMIDESHKTIFPTVGLNYYNNLEKQDRILYLHLSTIYRTLLNKYIKYISLQKYDDLILNSDLDFKKVKNEAKDFYQYYNNAGLNYYYVRNNIYVERLNEEEKQFLIRKMSNVDYNLDDESISFIEKTYKKLIEEKNEKIENNYFLNFGPNTSERFFSPNNSLVIGFRYDLSNSKDNWLENLNRKNEYSKLLNSEIEKDLKQKLNYEVKVITYDNQSTVDL